MSIDRILTVFSVALLLVSGNVRAQTASEALISLWADVKAACEERDRISEQLKTSDFCYSFVSQSAGPSGHWLKCGDRLHETDTTSRCVIADPTPTLLNIRTQPYGLIIGTIANGEHVSITEEKPDRTGNL